jgi:hypothetical protein
MLNVSISAHDPEQTYKQPPVRSRQAAQEDDMRGRGSEKSDAGAAGALLRPRSYFLDFS